MPHVIPADAEKFSIYKTLIYKSKVKVPVAYRTRAEIKLKSSVVDIQIKANFTENVPANTRAFALVISDKILSFPSDGNKMSVIY